MTDQLNIEKISELVTGEVDEMKEEVKNLDPSLQDLRALKKAEASGKNREEALDFLDEQITEENVSAYLGLAEDDVNELSDVIKEIERVEHVEHFEEENIEIDQDQLIDLVGGTVSELKEFVEEKPLTAEQLENILDAEKRVKDRKTAKAFLEDEIERRQISKDVEDARESLEELKKDLEKVGKDAGLEESPVQHDKQDETKREEKESTETEEDEESEDSEPDSVEEQAEKEKDGEKGEASKGLENDEEPESSSKQEEEDSGDLSAEERKKEIAEELDLEMDDSQLEELSLDDLKRIKEEKKHREDLIDRLSDHGMDEEDLRESSTADLEKLIDSVDEEASEEHEEMKEEAEQDLEMLMGAKETSEDEEDSGISPRDRIEEIKSNIRDKLSREEEEEEVNNFDKVEEVLDGYRDLQDEEAVIKSAQVMKGFLERVLDIERELTYRELSETMPEDDENMERLSEYFLKLHREQYTGKLEVDDPDEFIDVCLEVLEGFR